MRYIVKKENAETIYISGGIFVSNGKWTHPKMILDDYELVIVLKGRFQMRIGQARKEFLEGDCFILFPGEEHIGIEAAWDVSFYWLLLFNTIRISLLRLLCGFVPPIILSIMLFDMTSKKFWRISQSILGIYQQLFGLYRSRGQAVPDVGEMLATSWRTSSPGWGFGDSQQRRQKCHNRRDIGAGLALSVNLRYGEK